jgi:hypothetical protein
MFTKTIPYKVDDAIVFGLMEDVVVPDASDEVWTVPAGAVARLDRLSNAVYGTPDLWHVLASVNNLIDALSGFPAGTKIRVPTKSRLASEGILGV